LGEGYVPVVCFPQRTRRLFEAVKVVEEGLGIELALVEDVRLPFFSELPRNREAAEEMLERGEYFHMRLDCVWAKAKDMERLGLYADDVGAMVAYALKKLDPRARR